MEKNEKKHGKRLLCIVLSVLLTLSFATVAPVSAEAITAVDGTVSFYEWNRVYSYSDLPTDSNWHRAILAWHNEGWYTNGNDFGGHTYYTEGRFDEDKFMSYDNKFLTYGARNSLFISYDGQDTAGDNDYPTYNIILSDFNDTRSEYAFKDGDNDLSFYSNWEYSDSWGIVTGHHRGTDWGNVKVFYNDSGGYDTGLNTHPGTIYGDDDGTGWDFSQFAMYIGTEKIFSAITHDFTIRSGQTLNVDDQVVLMEGVTLTVEEGAILSIEGRMFNNGKIVNKGTLIVQENACISPFDPKTTGSSGSGYIQNDGGDMIVLPNGRVYCEKNYGGLLFRNGSTCVNCGIIIAAGYVDLKSNAVIDNRESGKIYLGYEITNNVGSIESLKITGSGANTALQYMSACSGYGWTTFSDNTCRIENKGAIYQNTHIWYYAGKDALIPLSQIILNQEKGVRYKTSNAYDWEFKF